MPGRGTIRVGVTGSHEPIERREGVGVGRGDRVVERFAVPPGHPVTISRGCRRAPFRRQPRRTPSLFDVVATAAEADELALARRLWLGRGHRVDRRARFVAPTEGKHSSGIRALAGELCDGVGALALEATCMSVARAAA
jgi:hypothetical protein